MLKKLSILGAVLALLFVAFAGQATPIKANYSIDANSTDPGLVVHTNPLLSQINLDLTEGASATFGLFNIWTDESSVNNDDRTPRGITANFDFLLPDVFSGQFEGDTLGLGGRVFLQGGAVHWAGPADLYFGPKHDGRIRISLSDEIFNGGIIGTLPGRVFGATVNATVTLVKDATAVPAPGMLGVLGLGLVGLGVALRRRKMS